MPSFAEKLAKMKKEEEQPGTNKEHPEQDTPPAAPTKAKKNTPAVQSSTEVKQKYSIYITDGERAFLDEYKYDNRKCKVAADGTLRNVTYSDIISEALALLAKEHGYTIQKS